MSGSYLNSESFTVNSIAKTIIMNTSKYTLTLILLFVFSSLATAQDFNDLQIASIAVTANQVDIEYAEIAEEKASNDMVVGFAETMIRDHSAVVDKAVALVEELGVTPDHENKLTQKLRNMADETKSDLRSKNGEEFDKAYMENEVAYHETVIEVVRDVLIPQTENEQLKELLEGVLPSLEAHYERAKTINGELSSDSSY